jgi:arylsulfatase A-like enzyme
MSTKNPNVVLILMDNLGYGEIGCYGGGIIRGAPTPRIDALATEGMRLLNFNVESNCTPSRTSLMTGRYPIRGGHTSIPWDTPVYGLLPWERTLGRILSDAGYATGMFGKWHLGQTEGRFPTDHGFDEWYGIPNSSDEAMWPEGDLFDADCHPFAVAEHVMEGRKGEVPRKLQVYNMAEREEIDGELTVRAIDYMERQAKADKPFFLYVPYTQTHFPVLPSKEFRGTTGNGKWADVLAQTDVYVGRILDTVDRLGLRDDTIFIFTSDNGPEMNLRWAGSCGPWRGSYNTAMEGSLRVPFIIRWPGRIAPGAVSNEVVHEMDVFPTLAAMCGARVPTDRIIDGVDQSPLFLGTTVKSAREGFVVYVGKEIFGVKWKHWKMLFKEFEKGNDPIRTYNSPMFYNLLVDPKEENAAAYRPENFWVRWPASDLLKAHRVSLQAEPPPEQMPG